MRRTGTTAAVMPPSGGCRRLLHPCAAHALVLIALAVVLCSVPYGVHFGSVPGNDYGVHVVKSEADALTGARALEYLTKVSNAADLTVSEYVITSGICIGALTGYCIFDSEVSYSADQTTSVLNKLATTAEWPAWSNASEDAKTYYGTEENYKAAQFNSLLGCVGLAESRDTFYASGGDLDEGADSIAGRVGEIGKEFLGGGAVKLADLYLTFNQPKMIFGQYGNQSPGFGIVIQPGYIEHDGCIVNYRQSWFSYVASDGYANNVMNSCVNQVLSNVLIQYAHPTDQGTRTLSKSSVIVEVDGVQYYEGQIGLPSRIQSVQYNTEQSTFRWAGYYTGSSFYVCNGTHAINTLYSAGYQWWDGTPVEFNDLQYGQAEDTPENLINDPGEVPDQNLPNSGNVGTDKVNPSSGYNQYFINQPGGDDPGGDTPTTPRPENPYNPSDPDNPAYQSGTPEWKQETTENLMPLLNVHLDRLFPFCLLYDLNSLWGKVQGLMQQTGGLSGQDYEDYLHISFPIEMVSPDLGIYIDEQIEFDLTPLHDLLLMTKTAVFVLLIFMTLLSLIRFWQRILTGG